MHIQILVGLGACGKIQVAGKNEGGIPGHGKNFPVHELCAFGLGVFAVVVKVDVENIQGILIEFEFCPSAVAGVLGIPALAFLFGSLRQVESPEEGL